MSKGCLLEYLTGIKCNLFTIVSLIFTWFVLLIHIMCNGDCSVKKLQKDNTEEKYVMNITGIKGQDVDLKFIEKKNENNKLIYTYEVKNDQGTTSFKQVRLELEGVDPKQIEKFRTPIFKSGLDKKDDDGIVISIPKGTKAESIEAKIFIDDKPEAITSQMIPS